MVNGSNSYSNELHTADSRPLSEILAYGQALTEEYNDAPRPFQALLGRVVDNRVFRRRTNETAWEQVAEGERPHVGADITTKSMAFTIDEFSHAVGWTRNEVEDNPAELLREDLEAMIEAADELVFEKTFEVMDGGIADGTVVEWFDPPSPGNYAFAGDHNHVFDGTNSDAGANSNPLFDDSNAHTAREHIHKAAVQLAHHNYAGDVAFVNPEFAYSLLMEDTSNQDYQIREARDLLTTPLGQINFKVGGTRVVQSAEVPETDFYVFDTSKKPLYYNWVRPIELAQENGAPVVDPSELLQAVGSTRFGIKMANPFAGVKITPTNLA